MIRHILMTADVTTSEWGYSVELSRALARHGIRVSLSTSGGVLTKDQRREAARVPGLAIYDGGFNLDWSSGFPDDVAKASRWMLTLEERLKPDIVHVNGYRHGPISFTSPVVVSMHAGSISLSDLADVSDHIRFRAEVKAVIELANLLLVPTLARQEELAALYSIKTPIRVIPHFRRTSDFRSVPKQKFVYSAGIASRSASVKSAIETAAGEYNWPVIVDSELHAGASAPHGLLAARVPNHTRAALTADSISKAAIYCLPVDNVSSDVPVLEGALSRCAMVVSDLPHLRENWNNCALFVRPDDAETLKTGLKMLISDQSLREEMAQRAYERAREFSPERCIDEYLDAYQAAATSKVRPSMK